MGRKGSVEAAFALFMLPPPALPSLSESPHLEHSEPASFVLWGWREARSEYC